MTFCKRYNSGDSKKITDTEKKLMVVVVSIPVPISGLPLADGSFLTQRCLRGSILLLPGNHPILQGALTHCNREWYLESKVCLLGVLFLLEIECFEAFSEDRARDSMYGY